MMSIRRARRWRSALAAAALTVAALVVTPAAAASAAPNATEATLESVAFVKSTIQSGQRAEISGAWSLPDDPATPAGFSLDLPDGLRGLTDEFDLRDPSGVAMGHCVVTTTAIRCAFDSAYLQSHPRDLRGDFSFWVDVTTVVTEQTTVTYDFDGVEAVIAVTPPPAPCTTCTFQGRSNGKWGSYDRATNLILWNVDVKSPREGFAGGQEVTVLEHLGAQQEWVRSDTGVLDVHVIGTNQLGSNGYPAGWQRVDARVGMTVTETAEGLLIAFTSEEGWHYSVQGRARVADAGVTGTYANSADITIAGTQTQTVRSSVVRQGGGGTGSGQNVGRFSITKDVVWSDEPIAGLAFGGTYTVTAPSGVVTEGAFTVAEDATWTSGEFPVGSTVHVEEATPASPAAIEWAAPEWSQNDFALAGGTTTAVTLTNRAALQRGAFQAAKRVEGTGARLVDPGTMFLLDYSYPAGTGFAAGAGTLELPVDGAVVTSPQLPVGAELTLSERTPGAVEGAAWTGASLSVSTLTIGAGDSVLVTVTNTLTADVVPTPEPSETPTPEPTPEPTEPTEVPTPTPSTGVDSEHESPAPTPVTSDKDGTLAVTGGQTPAGLMLAGAALVAIGIGLVARRRRTLRD